MTSISLLRYRRILHRHWRFLELECVEPREIAPRRDQILNFPTFKNSPSIEDNHLVGIFNRADPVGNDDYGASSCEDFQSILYEVLGYQIQRIRCFVEDQDFRVADQSAG